MDLSQVTLPRALVVLAVLGALGWLWVLVDNGMPPVAFFLLVMIPTGAVPVIAIYLVGQNWLQNETPHDL